MQRMAVKDWQLHSADVVYESRNIQSICQHAGFDDYTDANGYLHRNAVELKALKVEFETPAMLTNKTFNEVLNNI